MAKTKVRGSQQIQNVTIVDIQISNSAAIQTSKLAEGNDFLKRNGLVVFTSSLNADGNTIENLAAPNNPNDIARKVDVESAALGLNVKLACRVATTGNVDLSSDLANGETIDGITLVTGDRVLVKNQITASQNGIYIVPASGAASRASDADASDKFPLNTFLFVSEGNVNEDTGFVSTNDGSFVLETDDLIFSPFSNNDLVNSASNVGSDGVGVFKQLNDGDLEFYKLNSTNNRLTIALDASDKIDFSVIESNINHNALTNYSIDQHREINDTGSAATDLWSASKISDELNEKADNSGHNPANILLADSFGDLQSVEMAGDLSIDESGEVSVAPEIIKISDVVINEIPSGDVDGINDTFELEFVPVPDSLRLFQNGVLKCEGATEDYTKDYKFITLLDAPEVGDKLRASYIKAKITEFPLWNSSQAFNYNAFVTAFQSREVEVNSQKSIDYVGSISMGSLVLYAAALGPDGNIYGPNASGGSMIKIDTTNDSVTTFGTLPGGQGYLSCVLAQNGFIYIISDAGNCFKVDPINEIITSLGNHSSGQFHYSSLAPNGCIYSSPYNSSQMFKIDTSDDSIHNFSGAFSGGYSFGIGLGSDGNMYCAPHITDAIIKIDTQNDSTSIIGTSTGTNFRYVGRCVLDTYGQMYFTPDHANNTLVLDIQNQTTFQVSAPGTFGPTRFVGGILSPYGSIFHGPATHAFLTETIPPSGNTENVTTSPNFGTSTWKYANPIISPQGNLYLLNWTTTAIEKFSLGGLSNYPLDFYLSPFVNHC